MNKGVKRKYFQIALVAASGIKSFYVFFYIQVYDIFKWAIGYINVGLYGVAEI